MYLLNAPSWRCNFPIKCPSNLLSTQLSFSKYFQPKDEFLGRRRLLNNLIIARWVPGANYLHNSRVYYLQSASWVRCQARCQMPIARSYQGFGFAIWVWIVWRQNAGLITVIDNNHATHFLHINSSVLFPSGSIIL